MAFQIVQEKFPLGRAPPPIAFAIAVEIDREGGDPIELAAEIGQWLEGLDRPDAALDVKQVQQPSEKRKLIDIQTKAGVPESLENEEKKAAAAAEIEDRLRPATVQLQVLRANDVQSQPATNISVFRVMLARPGVLRLDRGQFSLVDPGVDRLEWDWINDSLGPAPGPPIHQRLRELRDLMGKLHPEGPTELAIAPCQNQVR